jgi:Sodium:solute symporter family
MTLAIIAVAAVTLATVVIGAWGVRFARTTSDLYVASRAISPWWNAAAVSGEYLSAASFLGIAGLEMQIGVPALWQAVGFAAGYLALLLFVAAPLRRFGSYTLPDFAEGRLASASLRRLAVAAVLAIDGFYLVPQLKGAGIAFEEVMGAPYWAGIVVVGIVVTLYVALGGMRGVSYVQAFQFWVKTVTIALPAIVLLIYLGGIPNGGTVFGGQQPHAPRTGLVVQLQQPVLVRFPVATGFEAPDTRSMPTQERRSSSQPGGWRCHPEPTSLSRAERRRRPEASGLALSHPAARGLLCTSTPCCWRRSWGRWGFPTSSSGSIRTLTAPPRVARPYACSYCCPSPTCSPRSTARSALAGSGPVPDWAD